MATFCCWVGGEDEERSHFHLIAATNRPRQELQHSAAFRKDLFFRLADEIIEVPPLREILARHENPRLVFETLADHVAKREILGIPAIGTMELGDHGREVDQFLPSMCRMHLIVEPPGGSHI